MARCCSCSRLLYRQIYIPVPEIGYSVDSFYYQAAVIGSSISSDACIMRQMQTALSILFISSRLLCVDMFMFTQIRLLSRHVYQCIIRQPWKTAVSTLCYQVDIIGCSCFRLSYVHVYYQAALVDRSVDIFFVTYTYQAALLNLVVSRINIIKLCWHVFYHLHIQVALSSLVLSRIRSRLLFRYLFYHVYAVDHSVVPYFITYTQQTALSTPVLSHIRSKLLFRYLFYHVYIVGFSLDTCYITYTQQTALQSLILSRIHSRLLCRHLFYHVYIVDCSFDTCFITYEYKQQTALSSLILSRRPIRSRLLCRYLFITYTQQAALATIGCCVDTHFPTGILLFRALCIRR